MPRQAKSIVIRRPVEDVFAYMDDVSREPEWQPQLIEAEQIPAGPTVVGTRRRYVSDFLGKRLENTYVVKVYEPNSRLVVQTTKGSILDATSDVRWEAVPEGTRVTMTLDGRPKGALRFVPARMLESTFEKEVSTTLKKLKERLEA
jgi:uncharacterized membrane protein